MANYIERVIEQCIANNPGEVEFHQTIKEVLTSLAPVIETHPVYEEHAILERLVEPERGITFKIEWIDDSGKIQVNKGYRYQFNSALGPYKGGLRFTENVNPGVIKFLGFEQIFKNSLTGLPIGGGKGGSDFEPSGKSDTEVMRFCKCFITELYRHIGPSTDVPAGDIGVGAREIGYMFGHYKKIVNRYEGVLTGKGLTWGGLYGRTEATGYGIVYFANAMLEACGEKLAGKKVVVSGFGNVSWGTISKLNELGANVITISGPDGYILDEEGISGEKVDYLLELRASGENICYPYVKKYPNAKFIGGKKPWEVKADLYIPCATQNEITLEDAKMIVSHGCQFMCEGSNMSSTNEAIEYLQENDVIIGPSKAANAGGVACSCIEMGQNAGKTVFSSKQVHKQLEEIMLGIHQSCKEASEEFGYGYNLVAGANIAGFLKVADAMIAQGV